VRTMLDCHHCWVKDAPAQVLAARNACSCGYFMGDELRPGNTGNPRGSFANREIDSINVELLPLATRTKSSHGVRRWISRDGYYRCNSSQQWLAVLPLSTSARRPRRIVERIKAATARRFFCFADPPSARARGRIEQAEAGGN
jgi:hypothetical protein